jgi:hypothetical protein
MLRHSGCRGSGKNSMLNPSNKITKNFPNSVKFLQFLKISANFQIQLQFKTFFQFPNGYGSHHTFNDLSKTSPFKKLWLA